MFELSPTQIFGVSPITLVLIAIFWGQVVIGLLGQNGLAAILHVSLTIGTAKLWGIYGWKPFIISLGILVFLALTPRLVSRLQAARFPPAYAL